MKATKIFRCRGRFGGELWSRPRRDSPLFSWFLLLTLILLVRCQDFPNYDYEDMPDTPGFTTGDGVDDCKDEYEDSYVEYTANPSVAEGSWTHASMHDPTHLIATEDGYLLVFSSGQGFCGGKAIMYKYMKPGTTDWILGPQMYGADCCGSAPSWIPEEDSEPCDSLRRTPGRRMSTTKWSATNWMRKIKSLKQVRCDSTGPYDLSDFDAPEVLYSATAVFPTPSGDMRQWVMYYSRYLNDGEEAQACIGRATATGTPENLVWTDDGRPVYCSNSLFDNDGKPISLRYSTESEYVSKVNDGYGIDPALFIDTKTNKQYLTWGSGVVQLAEIDLSTGHLTQEAHSDVANGPTKDVIGTGNAANYHAISLGSDGFNEAPYIYYENGYYYLFVNWWACCAGVCSTYELRMGRATTVTGPYLDRDGHSMAIISEQVWGNSASGGTVLLQGEGRYIGPGHAGIMDYVDSDGDTKHVFTFHFYDGEENGTAKLAAREMAFDDHGWPTLSSTPWDHNDFMQTIL